MVERFSGCQAAVDADHLAMNVHRRFAAEKFDDGRDIIGLSDASQGNHGKNLFFGEIGGHVGFDQTWRDDVDADVSLADFAGEGFAGADKAGFGGGVVDLPSLPNLPGYGSDGDNSPAAGTEHGEKDGVHDVVKAVQIGADDIGPFLGLHPDQEIVAGDAGVKDDDGGGRFLGFGAEGFFGCGEIADVKAK